MKKPIILFITLLIFTGGILYVGWFLFSRIMSKRASLETLYNDSARIEAQKKRIKNLEDAIEDFSSDYEAINATFVDERSLIVFINHLEGIAKNLGADLVIENASLPTGGKDVHPEFQLKITGTFDQVTRFIKLIEVMPFQTDLSRFSMRKEKESGRWQGIISLRLLNYIFNE